MKNLRNSLLALLLVGAAWAQPPQQINFQTANPAPPTSCSTGIVGAPGVTTYYYWAVANYTIGQAVSPIPLTVNNAPNTLSGSNYVLINCATPPFASSIDILRTTNPSLSATGTQSIAVATAVTSGTTSDQGSALTAYTFNSITGQTGGFRLNNRDYILPVLEWGFGSSLNSGNFRPTYWGCTTNCYFVPLPIYATGTSMTVERVNAGATIVTPIYNRKISVVNFSIVPRVGTTSACTDVRIGDSNNANPVMIDPVANLVLNTANTPGTSTITQTGFGNTSFGAGLGVSVYKTGSACATTTVFDVTVMYTIQ